MISKEEILNNLNLLRYIINIRTKLNYYDRGLCPFHLEKTSSFSIYQGKDRARFHCFGCGADGDIFNYLSRIYKLNFETALLKINSIIKNESGDFSSFPAEKAEGVYVTNTNILPITQQNLNCIQKCWHYLDLEEDYRLLWEENQKFWVCLNLGNFQSKNEIEKI